MNSKRSFRFPLALGIYAAVFLLLCAVGLTFFWGYIDAYEQTRPAIAIDRYLQSLTPAYIAEQSTQLIDSVDHTLQNEDACKQAIIHALQDKFTCVKNTSASNEGSQLYHIRCGSQIIGSVTFSQQGESNYGFTPWQKCAESFDLSYLLSEPVSITIPEEYSLYVLDSAVPASCITASKIPYPLVKDLYNSYTFPYLVTYTVGPFLGDVPLTVKNAQGETIAIDSSTDFNQLLPGCTEEEKSAINSFSDAFILSWVNFGSLKNNDLEGNYQALLSHLIPNCDIQKRALMAFDGLSWRSDTRAQLTSVVISQYVAMDNGRYLCDLTYQYNEKTMNGRTDKTERILLILQKTDTGLKAEFMVSESSNRQP